MRRLLHAAYRAASAAAGARQPEMGARSLPVGHTYIGRGQPVGHMACHLGHRDTARGCGHEEAPEPLEERRTTWAHPWAAVLVLGAH